MGPLLADCGTRGQESVEVASLDLSDPTTRRPFAAWIEAKAEPAANFVLSKFDAHDVVLIGENHEVRENCDFVSTLVPSLATRGIRVLATEFYRASQNADLEALVDGKAEAFDRARAIALTRDLAWPTWGHVEYLAIVEAVYRNNREARRAAGDSDVAPSLLRFVGIDSDWKQVDHWRSSKREQMTTMLAREKCFEQSVATQVDAGHKVLVHCGFAHSVTSHGLRLGTVLRKRYGQRVGQVVLHHDFGAISKAIEDLVGQRRGIGFDIVGSPFAPWRERASPAFAYVDSLGQMAEAWVFLDASSALHPTTWIDGFIDARHFEDALFVARKRRMVAKDAEVENAHELDSLIQSFYRRRAKLPPR